MDVLNIDAVSPKLVDQRYRSTRRAHMAKERRRVVARGENGGWCARREDPWPSQTTSLCPMTLRSAANAPPPLIGSLQSSCAVRRSSAPHFVHLPASRSQGRLPQRFLLFQEDDCRRDPGWLHRRAPNTVLLVPGASWRSLALPVAP